LEGEQPLIAEIAALLCFELAHGPPLPWRVWGYRVLACVYDTVHGGKMLVHLGRSDSLINDLATNTFLKYAT
jgi:hypothetical protein